MMKIRVFYLSALFNLLWSCNGQQTGNIETLAPQAFAGKLTATPDAQLLDVRTPEEYVSGHIDKAQNVDWLGDDFNGQAAKYDKDKPVFVYCKVGGRSAQAATRLADMGFKKIYNLKGGYVKWEADGLAPKSDRIIGMCDQEYGEMIRSSGKVLVDFNAKWCAPCQKMKPFLEAMKKEHEGKVAIVSLNADENKTMISALNIDELPALLFYENGKLVWQQTGYISEEDLKSKI